VTEDALTRIRDRGHIGIRLGLARMEALLAVLGDPQQDLHGVLIAGTNGKGSVAAMVAAMVAAGGYSTSQSPSPHLHSYRERITLDGHPIEPTDLDGLLDEVLAASQPGELAHGPATEFELLTAAAYLWSARRGVDVVVMEVGLGGRLDASNTWHAEVAAVTNIGLDHQEFLGDTLESVATEKAAIIKPGARAVTGAMRPGLDVVEQRAADVGVPLTVRQPLTVVDMDRRGLLLADGVRGGRALPRGGRNPAPNASVALGIVRALGEADVASVPDSAIREGLAATRWPGRLELRSIDGRTVLFDGAHNPDGARALADTVDALADELGGRRATLLLGVMADKEVEQMLQALAHSDLLRAACFVACGVPGTDRSLPAADLAARWRGTTGLPTEASNDDADAALEVALQSAAREGGALVVTGSLYVVGHIRGRLLPEEVPV
jgi:dihydrofolate synthase/folylpolyglutamate synthase